MDYNFTDFTNNDTFETWTSSGDISSSTDVNTRMVHKRTHAQTDANHYGEPPSKRSAPSILIGSGNNNFKWNLQTLAAAAEAVRAGGKSPVSALNELGVKVHYSVLRQSGPAHCPSFNVAVTVANMRFLGCGHSKREARAVAARACLDVLVARAGATLCDDSADTHTHDFTSDDTHMQPVSEFQCAESKMSESPSPPAQAASPPAAPVPAGGVGGGVGGAGGGSAALFGSVSAPTHKSPINVLYEKYAGLVFTCTYGDGSPLTNAQPPVQLSHSMRFKVVCQIKEQKFEGYGSSKKLAKLAAARSALAALEESRDVPASSVVLGNQPQLHQTLADHIGKLVNEKFTELMKEDVSHARRKVLAGIVITTNLSVQNARVIGVTTGTKCISGEHMSVSGLAVNDCHAEVLARRCLQRHLYAELWKYAAQADPTTVIEDSDIQPNTSGGYSLKSDRQVHLYVSTAPCGDGRIFSPHESRASPDRHPNRLARGQLRTKIESGEGTIPVRSAALLQTWDGVLQGERLLTMSCSDKVARWAVCGVQGALLSRFLSPVYLHSLVLGSLLHSQHLYRAVCGRFESHLTSLPPPFRLSRPRLASAASAEARSAARAPAFSVCWSAGAGVPEVLNAATGKLDSGQPSLLCKHTMFARWLYLVHKLPPLPREDDGSLPPPAPLPDKLDSLLYGDVKQMSVAYQTAKQQLFRALSSAGLGSWIKRPLEQDQFVSDITAPDPNVLFT